MDERRATFEWRGLTFTNHVAEQWFAERGLLKGRLLPVAGGYHGQIELADRVVAYTDTPHPADRHACLAKLGEQLDATRDLLWPPCIHEVASSLGTCNHCGHPGESDPCESCGRGVNDVLPCAIDGAD